MELSFLNSLFISQMTIFQSIKTRLTSKIVHRESIEKNEILINFVANEKTNSLPMSKVYQAKISKEALAAFLFAICMEATPMYSSNGPETEKVQLENTNWNHDEINDNKDFLYPPITAYIESSILYIQNDKPNGDLDIAIVSGKSGRVVWNQVYPKAATSLMAIPLDALPVGEYSLQVVNEWGGYL